MLTGIYKEIYIIGGNAAGLAAANQVKRVDPDLNVTVLEAGPYISYGSCGLPYFIAGTVPKIEELFAYPRSYFEEKRNIRILINHRVVSINTTGKEITAARLNNQNDRSDKDTGGGAGTITFNYDRLIICSGSSPIEIDVPGTDAGNVFYFHSVGDALCLNRYLLEKNPKKAVIVGGGYIGLLLAEALAGRGINTTIIEKKPKVFSFYEDEITDILYERIKQYSIKIITGSSLESVILNSSSDTAYAVSAFSKAGDALERFEIDADLIVIAAGVKPNTVFLAGSAIDLGINNAIKVSARQKTSQPNIFAAGDCCTVKNLVTGLADYIPTSVNAIKAGRVAGANAAGMDEVFPGSATTRIEKVVGLEFARTGIGVDEAKAINKDVLKITGTYRSHADSIPGSQDITTTLIIDKNSRRLLGAQMAGKEGVAKRIDTFAAAVTAEMTVDDIYMLDLSYSPPVAIVPDVVNRICGKAVVALDKIKNL